MTLTSLWRDRHARDMPERGVVEGHWDVVLVSEHDDNEALEAYQAHPAHLEAAGFIRSVTNDRATVDHEV